MKFQISNKNKKYFEYFEERKKNLFDYRRMKNLLIDFLILKQMNKKNELQIFQFFILFK